MVSDGLGELLLELLGEAASLGDLREERVVSRDLLSERLLPLDDAVGRDAVKETLDTGEDDGDLDLGGEGLRGE